jgi:hypothetical protein
MCTTSQHQHLSQSMCTTSQHQHLSQLIHHLLILALWMMMEHFQL